MLGRRFRRIGATSIAVSGIAVIVALATGDVGLVTTYGVSMLPRFHTGDLAVIVPAAQYRIGDIVGYHSPLLHITVLHRIVAEHGGLFTFKGDHNSFRDPVALPESAIKGRLWLHLPHVGTVLGWVRSPLGLGLLAFLVVGLGVVGAAGSSRRRRAAERTRGFRAGTDGGEAERPRTTARALPVVWWPVVGLLIGTVMLGFLTGASWSRPTTRISRQPVSYDQHVTFGYSATASPGVTYPNGSVVTTDPVFLRLVSALDIEAGYAFDATSPGPSTSEGTDLSGTIGAQAVLEGPGGWSSRLVSVAPVPFSGSKASIEIPVDLSQITTLEARFTAETGLPLATTTITVTPKVRIRGVLDGARVNDTFAPPLALQMSGGVLNLESAPPSGSKSAYPQLTPSHSGSVDRPVLVTAQMSILGRSLDVLALRRVAIGGWAVLIAAAIVAVLWFWRRRRMDESARIRAAYGHELVAVSSDPATHAQLVVDVETFGELAHLARRYDCVILEHTSVGGHAYYVECGATVYRCGIEGDSSLGPPPDHHADELVPVAAAITAHDPVMTGGPVLGSTFDGPDRRARSIRSRADGDPAKVADEVDLLTSLAKAELVSGVGDAAAHLHAAAIMAKKAGLDRAMVEPLLVSVRTSFNAEQQSDPEKIELLEYSLARPEGTLALRARLLGALAVELIFVGDATVRGPMLEEARELARRSCDPRAIMEASACHFLGRPRSSWTAGQVELDRAIFDDVVNGAVTLADPLWMATMQDCAAAYAMMAGDGDRLRAHVRRLSETSAAGQNQVALRAQRRFEHTMAIIDGRLGDAEALALEVDCVERNGRLGDVEVDGRRRQLALRREQGRLEELIPLFADHPTVVPTSSTSAAVMAFLSAEVGDLPETVIRLESVRQAGIRDTPDDADWPLVMSMLSEATAYVGDWEVAAILHELISPHDSMQMWTTGINCGPAARLLAMLEYALGWEDHTDWHFAQAIESSQRVRSPVWAARCQLDWARTWIDRGETVRAVQLIYGADAAMEGLELPALQHQSSKLKRQLDRR
ncbi:MAG TPA: signal peptidase I [Acidimicrobiales bacterium]|nr:signal peptidase I [Acidimicrobiales bacterium]